MEKRSVVDQIEIQRDGSVQVRIAREVVDDDGSVLSREWHRTSLPPGMDVDSQMAAVNQHLRGMNGVAVPAADIARVKAATKAFWTKAVLDRHNEKAAAELAMMLEKVERESGEQPT